MLKKRWSKKLQTTLAAGIIATSITPVLAQAAETSEFQEINIQKIMDDIALLAVNDNARVTGFEGEHDAANYLVDEFQNLGIKTRKQMVTDIVGYIAETPEVYINGEAINAKPLTYSNKANALEGELVYCGLGKPDSFNNIDVKGKIALIKRGEISFADKVNNATANGAKGVIIYNNVDGALNGTLGNYDSDRAPSVSIDKATGDALTARINQGEKINASITLDTQIEENSYSYNVVANIPAANSPRTKQTIVLGAHFDSVQCPGANDNASGTAAILEIAKILSQPEYKEKLNYNIEIVAFGAEEIGLIGSQEYVKSLQDSGKIDKVKGMINLDMIGLGDAIQTYNIDPNASHDLTNIAEKHVQNLGYDYGGHYNSSSSDHAPFEAVGVPSVFLNYSPDPNYHTDKDITEAIDPQNVENMINVVLNIILDMQDDDPRVPVKTSKYSTIQFENEEIPSK